MIKILLILLYIYNGELKLEQRAYPDTESCQIAGGRRVAQLQKDPKFDEGLFAACATLKVEEASKEGR